MKMVCYRFVASNCTYNMQLYSSKADIEISDLYTTYGLSNFYIKFI